MLARIKIKSYDEATGRLKEIYDDLIDKRGKLAGVHCIQSLRPESIVSHMDLYMEIMFSRSGLSRAEREMIAVVVSSANRCEYCQMHHAAALNHYWRDEEKVLLLRKDYKKVEITEREQLLCRVAYDLTIDPGDAKDNDITIPLRDAGLDDSAILDATLVVAYFNFVNRIVLALDVSLESDSGKGYRY